jgi:hypothetical protein
MKRVIALLRIVPGFPLVAGADLTVNSRSW